MRRMMQSHKRIGYFFPSLFKKQTPGLREYTQNFRTTEREKHSFFFFPLPRNCLAAAVFPLFRITLPMFRICYKLCIGSISRRDLWPALVAKPPNLHSPLTYILQETISLSVRDTDFWALLVNVLVVTL